MFVCDVVCQVLGCERGGLGRYVNAVDVEVGDGGTEEGVQVKRDAACARAEVKNTEGGVRLVVVVLVRNEGGEVSGYGFCFWARSSERLIQYG